MSIQDGLSIYKTYPVLKNAETIEEILCLATLISSKILDHNATLEDAKKYYVNLEKRTSCGGCINCPSCDICLACIINE
jgi:hypothetical protein